MVQPTAAGLECSIQALDAFKRSGEIVARLRKKVRLLVVPNKAAVKICEEIGAKIKDH